MRTRFLLLQHAWAQRGRLNAHRSPEHPTLFSCVDGQGFLSLYDLTSPDLEVRRRACLLLSSGR